MASVSNTHSCAADYVGNGTYFVFSTTFLQTMGIIGQKVIYKELCCTCTYCSYLLSLASSVLPLFVTSFCLWLSLYLYNFASAYLFWQHCRQLPSFILNMSGAFLSYIILKSLFSLLLEPCKSAPKFYHKCFMTEAQNMCIFLKHFLLKLLVLVVTLNKNTSKQTLNMIQLDLSQLECVFTLLMSTTTCTCSCFSPSNLHCFFNLPSTTWAATQSKHCHYVSQLPKSPYRDNTT